MNKTRILTIIMMLTLLSFTVNAVEQTVKTIELPIGFTATTTANTNYIKQLNMMMPDGYSDILGAYIILKGDYANTATTINARIRDNKTGILYTCTPVSITTPAVAIRNYEVLFDCTSVLKTINYRGGPIDMGFSTNKVSTNIFGTVQLTYYNQPTGTVTVHGTEYVAGQPAKIWLQLLDSLGEDVINGACYTDIYTPS
jgi:hypothetical protein